MNNIPGKLVFIGLLVALCLWSVVPPDQKIRLGKDLQGGVSLVYAVKIADGADADEVLAQTIDVLKDRVNPQGVLDIAMQPVGRDRIEVVMPLPSPEVRELQLAYRDALEAVMAEARLTAEDLEAALEAGDAATRFGGDVGDRTTRLRDLQTAWNDAASARTALAAAESADPVDQAEVDRQLDRLAAAEIRIEDLRDGLLAETLREQRLLDILGLDGSTNLVKDDGTPDITDTDRGRALAELRTELPHLAASLATLEAAHAAYEAKRTGLDDPEDLKRLLRGAGVLEFRIAVRPAAQDVPIDLLREQLAERGPNNTDSVVARWFPINDLKQWTDEDKPETIAALQADPIGYFQSRYNLVAAEKEGRFYLLLYTTP